MRIVREVKTPQSFRVSQIAGMFDVPLEQKITREWNVSLPINDFDWQIGLIVGPSGCGKSTIAKELWPDSYTTGYDWDNSKSILDNFPKELGSKEIIGALTSVGFSSPPDWVKPFSALSTGQQMRCNLARAVAGGKLVVFDEFTSVVDRTVARVGSAALAKTIRQTPGRQFVAVTCHADVLEWLTPDWVYEPDTNTFARRLLQRPQINLEVFRVSTKAWTLFKQNHYLSQDLNPSAICFLAEWEKKPVGFVATLPVIGFVNARRESRIVILPDYQGIGIGSKLSEAIGDYYLAQGIRYRSTSSHPGFIVHRNKSKKWTLVDAKKTGSRPHSKKEWSAKSNVSFMRSTTTFEYVGSQK